MVGDFGWEHEGTKSGVGTVKSVSTHFFTKMIDLSNEVLWVLAG